MIVIFNPTAGRRRVAALWRVLDILAGSGVRIDVVATRAPGDATEFARTAAEAGEMMVVGAGGDGTIAEVAQGLAGTPAALGIIPMGTANVLAHELGLPFAPRDIAGALARRRTRRIWPGNYSTPEGARLFVQMVGVGFDASVVHTLPRGLKRVIGRSAYVWQTISQLANYAFPRITLRIDGETTEAGSVIVTKGRFYAGTYVLAPTADPAERGFRIALFDRGGPAATLMYGATLPSGLVGRMPGVRMVSGHEIEFVGNNRVPVQADGDPAGFTPIRVSDARAPLDVVIA